jgi:hypothetical protein
MKHQIVTLLVLFSLLATAQEAEQNFALQGFNIDVAAGWVAIESPASEKEILAAIGSDVKACVNPLLPGLIIIKGGESATAPAVQISTFDFPGLQATEASLEQISASVEEIYRRRLSSFVRVFSAEVLDVAGLRSIAISGILDWRNQNYRFQQFLIPGKDRLYSAIYIASESAYNKNFAAVEKMLSTLRIEDKPLNLGWVKSWIDIAILIFLAAILIWAVSFANDRKPRLRKADKTSSSSSNNPFVR